MVKLTIDNRVVEVPEGTSVLEAAASVGIHIPTLCFLKDINEIAACRVCVVELKGKSKLIPACNTPAEEGMEILTNSPKVRSARKTNVQLILSQHDYRCATCVRCGNCSLQEVAQDLGIMSVPYEEEWEDEGWSKTFPLIRDAQKCIRCMRCIQVCDKIQGCNVWDVANTGGRTTIGVSGYQKLENSKCSLCGQCITHCPVGALHAREDWEEVLEAIGDPEKITLVQVAPAVRTAWAETLGLSHEEATPGRMAAALRRLGFDYVFDTTFGADLTIMEEASEFLDRFESLQKDNMPMFTSCCPGWVRFVKANYPDLVPYLSTAKSPQGMFGAISKSYFAQVLDVDPSKIYSVSIMPCTAKKHEIEIPTLDAYKEGKDVDRVLTTRELARMIRANGIRVANLEDEKFDLPLGLGTGAGEIFGVTGGVMEAALRTAYYLLTDKNPDADSFREVRGMNPWREAEFNMAGVTVRVAAVSGLGNTRKLIERMKSGAAHYDFIEVMACPGGCVGGGGQPIHDGEELAEERGESLYHLDRNNTFRFSHDNPSIQQLYATYLEKPLSHKAHNLLHTDHESWSMPMDPKCYER